MEGKSYEFYVNLINSGKKTEAVNAYLEEQNCGLTEAREYIDNLEKRCSVYSGDAKGDDNLIRLIKSGKKIEAIKYYRELTRCTLIEAKNYVENIEKSGNYSLLKPGNVNSYNRHDSVTSPNSGKTKFEGCFIATVCYDGYDTPQVIKLRAFRDDVLLKSLSGRLFVKIYYLLSPKISIIISKSGRLKIYIRKYVLETILRKL
jgi:ribosomal protein L7/L12